MFGAGDQEGYANSFQDALGILGRELRARGAKIVGQWATDGYTFSESQDLDDNGKFFALALDYDNQDKLTNPRIETWVQQIIAEMKLV